jgi:hypothetical protein
MKRILVAFIVLVSVLLATALASAGVGDRPGGGLHDGSAVPSMMSGFGGYYPGHEAFEPLSRPLLPYTARSITVSPALPGPVVVAKSPIPDPKEVMKQAIAAVAVWRAGQASQKK